MLRYPAVICFSMFATIHLACYPSTTHMHQIKTISATHRVLHNFIADNTPEYGINCHFEMAYSKEAAKNEKKKKKL